MDSVWVNQQPLQHVSALDRGLAYGDGLFATMRTYQGNVLLLSEHVARLKQSAERLHLSWQPHQKLIEHIQHVAQQFPNHCLKLVVTRGEGGRGYAAPEQSLFTEVLSAHDLPSHYSKWQQQGIAIQSSKVTLGHQPLLSGVKHLNRLEQVLIKSQQLVAPYQDWLVCDNSGNVIESSMANIFAVIGNEVISPALNQTGVAGVTRERLIQHLLSAGFNVKLQPMTLEHFAKCDHVFLTNSLFHIVDVIAIDDYEFKMWPKSPSFREKLLKHNE
ncbi:aminodeoxychorismate lyase [Shewanella maritima]|uniref:aminodeoxychorismate lyase n=1 Tax=Shewanella maritima TaxID=2520507 RepID=UPI003735B520